MIRVNPIIVKLTELKTAGTVNDVAGIGSVAEAPEKTIVTDSVFVMPPTKRGGRNNTGTSRVDQKMTVLVGVAIVFLGIGTGAGDELTDHIQDVCDAVEDQLLGWVPAAGASPFTLVSAGPEQVSTEKGFLIYSFIFETSYHARKP